MIEKHTRNGNKPVKVTFTVPVEWLPSPVSVVGDFNAWDPSANRMRKRGSNWQASVQLAAGERHSFRYLDVDGRWHDDPAADDVESGEHGVENCILDLTLPEP